MSVRIIGSSFATSALEVVILKTLHMFEVPFLLVGCFKYITSQFEVRFFSDDLSGLFLLL